MKTKDMEAPLKEIILNLPYEYRFAISAAVHAMAEGGEEVKSKYGAMAVRDCQNLLIPSVEVA